MANSGDIDSALVQHLAADAELKALVPDGVFFDEAPPNAKRFVIISLVDSEDERRYEGRAIESVLYRVTARILSTVPGADAKGAAARIDVLLDDSGSATFPIPGFALIALHRDTSIPRVRETEVDDVDPTVRWYHRGGLYRVVVSTP